MTAAPPPPTIRYSLRCLPVLAIALLPAACSAQTPNCSDDRVGAKVRELVIQQLSANYGLTAMYNLPATRLDLRAIRTVASDERLVSCRTELTMELELNSELKSAMAKPGGNATEAQLMQSLLGNNSRTVDLRYSVERTDDGRDLYVSIQRF